MVQGFQALLLNAIRKVMKNTEVVAFKFLDDSKEKPPPWP
jgi:hypothetical protein